MKYKKALHICKSGRPGPVWVEVPLDVQSAIINNPKKLKKFKPYSNLRRYNLSNTKVVINKLKKIKKTSIYYWKWSQTI